MTVEDWLVLTNRADIDEKEMVGQGRDFFGKTSLVFNWWMTMTYETYERERLFILTERFSHTGETVELVQQELPNWRSSTRRVEAGIFCYFVQNFNFMKKKKNTQQKKVKKRQELLVESNSKSGSRFFFSDNFNILFTF